LLFIGVAIVGFCRFASAQKSWEKKPYTEWSMSEAMQVLIDSPWAQTQFEDVSINYGLPANSYEATIRLRSALPIRQALLRQKQLLMNYEKFTAADKERFDRETSEFLECSDCPKYYIVTLGSSRLLPRSPPNASVVLDIVWPLRNVPIDVLKANVYLSNDKGDRRYLVRFITPKTEYSEAMFVFPRLDLQGKPLITQANKKFYFKIEETVFDKSVPLKRFSFDVSRLIQHGEVVF